MGGRYTRNEQMAPLFWKMVMQFKEQGGNLDFLEAMVRMVDNPLSINRLLLLRDAKRFVTKTELAEAEDATHQTTWELRIYYNLGLIDRQHHPQYGESYRITAKGEQYCQEFLEEQTPDTRMQSYLSRFQTLLMEFQKATGQTLQLYWQGQVLEGSWMEVFTRICVDTLAIESGIESPKAIEKSS
jgi:hypothetical protein